MNRDDIINKIAHTTGCSRKEVIATLRQFGMLGDNTVPQIKKGS